MNISGISLSNAYPLFDYGKISITGSKAPVKPEKTAVKSEVDFMVEQFKENNNPVTKKINQIMGKFMGGQELTPAELDFLAKNAPDCYQTVQEVMAERQQLEMKLEAAESKLEVLQVYTDALAMVKETKGTGEVEKQNAIKTLARVNQLGDAFGGFVASPEYAELPDEGDIAEEISEAVEEMMEDTEPAAEQMSEEADMPEEIDTSDGSGTSEEASLPEEEETAEAARPEGKEHEKKSKIKEEDKHLRRVVTDSSPIDIEFRRKVHDLYKSNMNRSNGQN